MNWIGQHESPGPRTATTRNASKVISAAMAVMVVSRMEFLIESLVNRCCCSGFLSKDWLTLNESVLPRVVEHSMNERLNDTKKLRDLRKLSGGLSLLIWPGLLGMAMSLFEGSWVWAMYCLLTGWIGIVIGLVGGAGWADHLLDQVPPHRQVSKTTAIVMSLFTYWIPTLAVLVYGLILAGALRSDLQPQSHVDGEGIKLIVQSAAMYFTAAGASWAVVLREVKILQADHGKSGAGI